MQQELSDILTQIQPDNPPPHPHPLQHGLQRYLSDGSTHHSGLPLSSGNSGNSGNMSPRSATSDGTAALSGRGVNPDYLDQRLRRLSNTSHGQRSTRAVALHQRITEHENAFSPIGPRQPLGFKVINRADGQSDGVQLSSFPNEILTHIMSYLHPDSHANVALVSKRFYTLVATPHAWRMAFQRDFPGHLALITPSNPENGVHDDQDRVRPDPRDFTRLTPRASWRSEYLLRTRLLRSLARGKPGADPGGINASSKSSHSSKASAVLTYNTKLPSAVTHIHATFNPGGKKAPRVIHGASDYGLASASDPTCGKVERWGLDAPFGFANLDQIAPNLVPYGLGDGPAGVPNVMDVSQPYGMLGGEGFPGGRVWYRATGEFRGKYLGQERGLVGAYPDIPKIPITSEGICSVWVAKSSSVPSQTQSLVGMLAGSSLGVVTAYALGYDPSAPRYAPGEISARWVLSPGVPIIALKIDDNYSQKRKSLNRVWAVALNALGEVYYLVHPPTAPASKKKGDDFVQLAWNTGRSTYWHLVETTRRQARPDEDGEGAICGTYSPRSSSTGLGLTTAQTVTEAREIERFLHYEPSFFRQAYYGWDMRRKLEVDFASDNEHGTGESVFVVVCGLEEDQPSSITRLQRSMTGRSQPDAQPTASPESSEEVVSRPSLFGGGSIQSPPQNSSDSTSPEHASMTSSESSPPIFPSPEKSGLDSWRKTVLHSKALTNWQITTTDLDASLLALVASFDDPLKNTAGVTPSTPATPLGQAPSDIPGRRARFFGVGTNEGKILLWNTRGTHTDDGLQPIRIIQTDSPEISCLALSAVYLVHGGSDGLIQAWDPLASTLEPIRTISSRTPTRIPRHWLGTNPGLRASDLSAVRAVYLDPDPTMLHGIVAFGSWVRYWAYSSSEPANRRKRRQRHSDIHGGRRHGGQFDGYIAAEAEELRNERERQARELARLQSRFGVGLGNLTEEEALTYAAMISQEAFQAEEQRRVSASDTGSAADIETPSPGSGSTVTPDPSVTGPSALATSSSAHDDAAAESDYERQIEAAIRLSLMEGANDSGESSRASSGEYEIPITVKGKKGGPTKSSSGTTSPSHTPVVKHVQSTDVGATGSSKTTEDDDLEFALQLSLAEEESRKASLAARGGEDEFPALAGSGSGKGKGKSRAA
ncbi:hypothetical protein GGR52DRAFT_438763 [Hypoxylon sp. FL1284]|nr:hypothetical protein GGR52DRAFT_438763 [Hypoxylon sp. FL1284]